MIDYDRKAVGRHIRNRRKALGISQEEFAERIGRVTKFCADIERGQAGMSIQTMLAICSLLKLSPDDLLLGNADGGTSAEDDLADEMEELEREREKLHQLLIDAAYRSKRLDEVILKQSRKVDTLIARIQSRNMKGSGSSS